ncbi:hypothetical protein MRB53_041337 [Persea americana]|nr:hypothetical protein MRB53_041337 [Persea americana]
MGLSYLQEFLDACTDCTIDCIALHWYNPSGDSSDFISHIQSAMNITSKPIYVSEFGITDGTEAEVTPFLETVMPWMDNESSVAGYAYYFVGEDYLMTNTGSAISAYGETYKSYSS